MQIRLCVYVKVECCGDADIFEGQKDQTEM